MNSARFFRTVRRIQAVAFALFCVLLCIALVFIFTENLRDSGRRNSRPADVVAEQGEALFLGSVRVAEGTPYVLMPLEARRSGKVFTSGPDRASSTRNILFYDTSKGEARWLRPDHSAHIVDYTLLRGDGEAVNTWERETRAGAPPVRWIRFEMETTVPTGAGGSSPERQLAVSGPGGEGFAVVLEHVDEVLGYAPPRESKLVVFFRRGDTTYGGEVDLDARVLRRTFALPKS